MEVDFFQYQNICFIYIFQCIKCFLNDVLEFDFIVLVKNIVLDFLFSFNYVMFIFYLYQSCYQKFQDVNLCLKIELNCVLCIYVRVLFFSMYLIEGMFLGVKNE